ncbi:radical SAM protein [Desulfobaculum xiamenense]|nr:radical SAM protein [Desulfobaculum xiamenense]
METRNDEVVRDAGTSCAETTLKSAVWFLTFNCNYRCPYCWEVQRMERGEFKPEPYVDSARWVEAWNRLCPDVLDISGGEPWLQPGFIDMLEAFDDRIRIAITTNASHDLTEFVQRISPEKVFSMTLSYHPSQRMNPEFFLGKCLLLKKRGFHITVNFVTWPEQMWLLPRVKKMFESNGVRFHVDPYAATPYKKYEFFQREMDFIRYYVGDDRAHWFGGVDTTPVLCSGGMTHLNVQPNGDAFRCINDKILDKPMVGNILDENFRLNDRWTHCAEFHRCPGCDKDKVQVRKLESPEQEKTSEPLSYTL